MSEAPNEANALSTTSDIEPVKPSLSFESVTFSNGDTLEFDEDEIIVLVGPNNAGKSATLKELQQFVSKHVAQNVVKNATLRRKGGHNELRMYLEKYASKVGGATEYRYAGLGYSIHPSHLGYFDNSQDRHPVASFFCMRLATETRITDSNPAGAIALHQEPPSHPIHLLLMDDVLTAEMSRLFHHAFGRDLIPFRAGGGKFPLYVGDKPTLGASEDELSRSFVERLQFSAVPLEQQGDGMRSFASVLLYVLAADHHSIQFLDEPEAFLHPPQARLVGEFIAKARRTRSQLFIATHSTDVLDGLISGGADKVRIIRIQREGRINRIKELSREKTAAVAKDTLARYSRVFDGIFYEHVVICESDADCLFYSSVLNTRSVSGDKRADVLFIHTAGKHRMVQLAETLRDLDVPVSVIADIDVLREENVLRSLLQTLGGNWAAVDGHFLAIKTSVEQKRPPLNAEQVASLIRSKLDGIGGTGDFPKVAETEIKRVFKTLSAWDEVKHAGRAALPAGQTVQHFDKLSEECSSVGLWIVPVGELEGFCRSVDGRHGPGFVAKVLEERNLEIDAELQDARAFVSKIWARARPE